MCETMTPAEKAAAKCAEPLPLDAGARKAFAYRQQKLIEWGTGGRRINGKPWPIQNWYNDEDFCRAYNTAVKLDDENKRLRAALMAQAKLMQQEADDARGDGRPGDGEFFDMCAADCQDAAKENP